MINGFYPFGSFRWNIIPSPSQPFLVDGAEILSHFDGGVFYILEFPLNTGVSANGPMGSPQMAVLKNWESEKTCYQWPWLKEPKLEVPTIYKAYSHWCYNYTVDEG